MSDKQATPFVITRDLVEQTELLTGKVRVPEWDKLVREQSGDPQAEAVVLIRELTAAERAIVSKTMVTTRGNTNVQVTFADFPKLQALIVVFGAHNEDGSPMFSQKDAGWLAAKSGSAVQKIAQAIQRLSGMIKGADEPAAVVDALGNSPMTQADALPIN